MAKRVDIQNEISKLTLNSTNLLVDNILKKHNVKLEKNNLMSEQKSQRKNWFRIYRFYSIATCIRSSQ
ncbi:hypothetical protein JOC95_001119 [Bacillus tianshenii]|uniref:Uncharacterized protein n=1 Tax=Sutcliffiella tianshenii TaxID=1463404 RepID=A0ABS2NX76_9BACI|nr:hypothetical protein [Bacillus tianshenii]MBM7619270.1 hypothetical protein [Bacillus tianshenii]